MIQVINKIINPIAYERGTNIKRLCLFHLPIMQIITYTYTNNDVETINIVTIRYDRSPVIKSYKGNKNYNPIVNANIILTRRDVVALCNRSNRKA